VFVTAQLVPLKPTWPRLLLLCSYALENVVVHFPFAQLEDRPSHDGAFAACRRHGRVLPAATWARSWSVDSVHETTPSSSCEAPWTPEPANSLPLPAAMFHNVGARQLIHQVPTRIDACNFREEIGEQARRPWSLRPFTVAADAGGTARSTDRYRGCCSTCGARAVRAMAMDRYRSKQGSTGTYTCIRNGTATSSAACAACMSAAHAYARL